MKAFEVAEKKSQDLTSKLAEANRDKKRAEATWTWWRGRQRLNENNSTEKAKEQAEQEGYDEGIVETEETFRAEVSEVCRFYCLQVWNEALDRAGVGASSALSGAKNDYYPPTIHPLGSSSSKADSTSKEVDEGKESPSKTLPPANIPSEVAEQPEDAEKVDDASKELAQDALKDPVKEKEASQHMEIVLASLPLPPKEDLKGKVPHLPRWTPIRLLKLRRTSLW
ncbi:hypothetical protein SO802_032346 [Lithocarpus litseifolius]|uniref:Uncharacterized protein n=1 Tax=Lithocarpus litseifolius TaxID=425828 RepID=A0AAW2BN65_9ROSI